MHGSRLSRRRFVQTAGLAAGSVLLHPRNAQAGLQGVPPDVGEPDLRLEIAPFTLEASPRHRIRTVAYNGQIPGPLLRMRQGRVQSIEVKNSTGEPEIVHWHGLFLPSEVDGAMEEGSPMIAAGATARMSFAPDPPGFRWFHTHVFAGKNLNRGQYTGLHGFLMVDPREGAPGGYDREFFLALHDWNGHFEGSDDGFMSPAYDVSTINGKMLGNGEPLQVKAGERVLLHVLNSSPTEVHWVALAGHRLRVVALDGNAVPRPQVVEMLRLAPAERVSVEVEMNKPGVWVLGEVRKHVHAAGMGIVVEYAGAKGKPVWNQPEELAWDYGKFAGSGEPTHRDEAAMHGAQGGQAQRIELAFESKFQGHGAEELWMINGKSYPKTDEPVLERGGRYRLVLKNLSMDDHPLHLHRHTFEVKSLEGMAMAGLMKDVVLVKAKTTAEVEFVAAHPGRTLFHCHQQDHMDRGFMMVFRYG
jgi:FtsP/CotA-like multicopper oxidase with cupredoxin domain